MPLHAGNPIRIARPFDRFNHFIWRVRSDAKIASRLEHGLMVRAVYANFVCSRHLGETRSWLDLDKMKRLRRFFFPLVLNLAWDFARDVLYQRTTQENVQALNAKTNG